MVEYRPLEGFVFAVTPFNFTSIGGNLPTAPALDGQHGAVEAGVDLVALQLLHACKLLEEAGLPPGVINFLPGSGPEVGDPVLAHPDFAGIHFTGSTSTFHGMWKTIGDNMSNYRSYPRIVGETGGKDFVFAHPSADVEALAAALVRGAFEYQGQKCSAASRAYVPASLWPARQAQRCASCWSRSAWASPLDFRNFMAAVIDKPSFRPHHRLHRRRRNARARRRSSGGGGADMASGYFIEPTVVRTENPKMKALCGGDLRAGAHGLRLQGQGDRRRGGVVRHDHARTP